MSFNDLAKKEAAHKKALEEKDSVSPNKTDESPAPGIKSDDPSKT